MLVDQGHTDSPVLAGRLRQARAWLAITVVLHVLMAVLTIVALLLGRVEQAGSLAIIIALAVGPPLWLLWLQRRRSSARTPHKWPWRSLAAAVPQTMALGFAGNAVLDKGALAPPLRLLIILAVALIPVLTAQLARRSLLRPLAAELGAGDFEVLVEPRTTARPWFYSDSIALTDREIVITAGSGAGRATYNPKTERIALGDITAIGARPALPQDSPWITLADGRGLSVPPGDVVVIRCRDTAQVLPVAEAAAFAEMVRIRAARVRGTAVGALPLDAAAQPRVQTHVPEVLPAPEPSGAVAHPVTGPVAAPRTGPGMAVRWGLGFPLALLGIVGVPVGLLLYGSLLTPEMDLELARLVFCGLWIALAAGIWLRSVQQPRYWPVWALTSGLATAVVVAVQELGLVALLGPIVGVLLTWAGRQVLIRPIGTDLAGSRLEIPVRLAGGETLLVQRDRMLLKVPRAAGGVVPQALALGQLTLIQLGHVAGNEARFWPLPGVQLRVWRGPVLRLVSGCQQWLIPVQFPRELAAIIRERSTAAAVTVSPITTSQWYEMQSWAARQLTTSWRGPGLRQRTVGFRLVVAFPAAFLGTLLFSDAIGRGENMVSGSGAVVAGSMLVVAMVSAADWIRVRRRLRVAEDNPLPPGSPAWGDLRADHAPLDGWQPWWTAGSDQTLRSDSREVGSR